MATEAEARERLCCGPAGCGETRIEETRIGSVERRYCVGVRCMAWRWIVLTQTQQIMIEMDAAQRACTPDAYDPRVPRGHCGLAGSH